MSNKTKSVLMLLITLIVVAGAWAYLKSANIAILEPSGTVGEKEKDLIIIAAALSLIVVIPVYIMLIGFAWRYREGNKKAKYDPGFTNSRIIEGIWWAVPLAIISVLAVITYRSSHELDPSKPLDNRPEMKVQVVSLQWKWLFIYPKERIASVNIVKFPSSTPIDFEITSDAPMNSFWIPQLGGQIYAMSGMSTHLRLDAKKPGTYTGSSANISGRGFSNMRFSAEAESRSDFNDWVNTIKMTSPNILDAETYEQLAMPGIDEGETHFGSVEAGLFDKIVSKYMAPKYSTNLKDKQ